MFKIMFYLWPMSYDTESWISVFWGQPFCGICQGGWAKNQGKSEDPFWKEETSMEQDPPALVPHIWLDVFECLLCLCLRFSPRIYFLAVRKIDQWATQTQVKWSTEEFHQRISLKFSRGSSPSKDVRVIQEGGRTRGGLMGHVLKGLV